jgi:hypothetical protein
MATKPRDAVNKAVQDDRLCNMLQLNLPLPCA